jgi:hypothetical protein
VPRARESCRHGTQLAKDLNIGVIFISQVNEDGRTKYAAALEEMNSKHFDLNKRLNFTHSLDNTLHSCAFNHVQCTSKDFVKRQKKMKGTCYVFNSGVDSTSSLKISAFPGQSHQFQMELYVNFHESLSEFTSYMGSALGAFIRIENSSYSSSNVGTDWIQIESGKRTFIAVDRVLKFYMSKPYSTCDIDNDERFEDDSELYKLILHSPSPYQYTQQFCFTQCYQRELVNECNCTDNLFVSLFESWQECSGQNQSTCADRVYLEKYSNETIGFLEKVCLPL